MPPLGQRLVAVLGMLVLRPGWRKGFDIGPSGFVESFAAAIVFAAPFFYLSVAAQNAAGLALAEDPSRVQTVGPLQGVILYVLLWVYFPLVARGITRAYDAPEAFAPWVIVHNWTVLALLIGQGLLGAALMGGVLDPVSYVEVGTAFLLVAIYAHCRVALGSLGAPWPVAIGAACVAILVWLIVQLLLTYAFEGGAMAA